MAAIDQISSSSNEEYICMSRLRESLIEMGDEFSLVQITSRESVPAITLTLLIVKLQITKFTSAKYEKKNVCSKLYRTDQRLEGNSVNQDEAAHQA